ncbi:MAG: hypothetical protein C4523_21360 [Myxococcales bacterium]|nr:MAG: hypothetical protein C4523_21360 [Myxococcales bacterium]
MRRAGWGLVALLLLAPSAAQAITLFDLDDKPLTLNIDESFGVEWHNNHDFGVPNTLKDDYVKLENVLSADFRWQEFTLGMRVEGNYYPDPLDFTVIVPRLDRIPLIRTQTASENDFHFEKYYFIYDSPRLRVDVGDYYVTFGRGLALALQREADDSIDTTLTGGKARLSIEDTTATLLAGFTNTLNVDPNHETRQDDPRDLIWGARLEQRIADFMTVGGHAAYTEFGELEGEQKKRFIGEADTTIAGGTIEFPDIGGHASVYFEGDWIRRRGREVTEEITDYRMVQDDGFGLYGSLAGYVENATLTAEYKYYNDFIFRRGRTTLGYMLPEGEQPPDDLQFFEDIYYNNVPTLERTDIETNRTYGNDHGFRIRADYNSINTGTQPYVALYYTRNIWQEQGTSSLGGFGSDEDFEGDRIWHAYGGVTQMIGEIELLIDGGFRDEYSLDENQKLLQIGHAKTSGSFPLVAKHSLGYEFSFLHKNYVSKKEQEFDYDLTLNYSFTPYLSLSFLYTLQRKDYLPSSGEDETNHFFAGEAASTLFDGILRVSIFGGQVRESIRCYGGFCRKVPPFEGVKAKIRVAF